MIPTRWITALCLGIVLTVTACAQPPDSGAQGIVLLGPMCPGPARVGGPPCPDLPVARTLEALTFGPSFVGVPMPWLGLGAARFASGRDGRFRVSLPPGQYLLYGRQEGRLFPCQGWVDVRPHAFTQATVSCSTGLA